MGVILTTWPTTYDYLGPDRSSWTVGGCWGGRVWWTYLPASWARWASMGSQEKRLLDGFGVLVGGFLADSLDPMGWTSPFSPPFGRNTPLKINMQPKNEGLEDHFFVLNGWFVGSMLVFRGVSFWNIFFQAPFTSKSKDPRFLYTIGSWFYWFLAGTRSRISPSILPEGSLPPGPPHTTPIPFP